MSAAHHTRPAVLEAGRPRWATQSAELLLGLGVGCATGLLAGASFAKSPLPVGLAIGVLTLPLAAAVIGGMRRLLLAFVLLDTQLQLDVNPGYRDGVAQLSALSGWTLSLTTVSLLALYLGWATRLLVGPKDASWPPRLRASAFPLAFAALTAASLFVAKDRTLAGFEVNLLVQLALLFVYITSTVRTRSDVAFIVTVLLVGLCLQGVIALTMFATGVDLRPGKHAPLSVASDGGLRLTGTFGSPNEAGSYFAFMVPLAIAVFIAAPSRRWRRLALCSCVLGVTCLALTLSRGAWIAFVVAVAVLAMGTSGSIARMLSRRALIGIVLAITIVLTPFYGEISTRLTGPDAGAAESRKPLAEIAHRMIAAHPLRGVGANNFVVVLPDYAGPEFDRAWMNTVHNRYLLVWSEAGAGALLVFVLFLGTTIRNGWRARRHDDPLLSSAGLGLGAAVAGMAAHMNFDILHFRPSNQTLWFAAAVLAAPAMTSTARIRRAIATPSEVTVYKRGRAW